MTKDSKSYTGGTRKMSYQMGVDELMKTARYFINTAENPPLVEEDEGEDPIVSPLELNCRGLLFLSYGLAKKIGVSEDHPNIARAEQLYFDSFSGTEQYARVGTLMDATKLVLESIGPRDPMY